VCISVPTRPQRCGIQRDGHQADQPRHRVHTGCAYRTVRDTGNEGCARSGDSVPNRCKRPLGRTANCPRQALHSNSEGFPRSEERGLGSQCSSSQLMQRSWMPLRHRPLFRTRNLKKRRIPTRRNPLASAARSAAGRPAKKITGSVSAVIRGIPLIREASAQRASTSGMKRSASPVQSGRLIRSGTQADPTLNEVIAEVRLRYRSLYGGRCQSQCVPVATAHTPLKLRRPNWAVLDRRCQRLCFRLDADAAGDRSIQSRPPRFLPPHDSPQRSKHLGLSESD
jgi:hypothetical protein